MRAVTSIPVAQGALPVLGHALPLFRDPLAFLRSLPSRGDLVRVQLGRRPIVMACDPDLTRQVLLDDRTFDKGGVFFDRVREIIGDGLASCPHDMHRRQRRLCQPSFHPDRLPGYAAVMSAATQEAAGLWRDGRVIDVPHEVSALIARATVKNMLATSLAPATLHAFLDDLASLMELAIRRVVMPPLLSTMPGLGGKRFDRARDNVRNTVADVIAQRRSESSDRGDLLSALIGARDLDTGETHQVLGESELGDQVVTFLIGGTETTSATVAWALYLLATHPHVEAELHTEVDSVLAGAPAAFTDLPALKLTGHVITETLRLYPPAWLLTRHVSHDTELGRVLLPAGTHLAYSPYLIHHRPDLYPHPEQFDPGRWRDNKPDRNTYIPYGAGARKCIGDHFAHTHAVLALATITTQWRLRPVTTRPVRPALRTTLAPQHLHMRPVNRHPFTQSRRN